MIPLDEARARVFDRLERLHPKALPLGPELAGCVLSVAVHAPEDVPPFANTAVDGYAVRAADTAAAPCELTVVGTLAAGAGVGPAVGPGEAVRIMTGAPMPPGADAVVMVEDTDGGVDVVRVRRAVKPGDAVRPAGDDVRTGELVFPPFTVLTPAALGVLASMGFRRVPVYPRPRVGVLSTGDELVDDGSPLQPGQIRESNRVMLLGLVAQAGCVPVDLGTARDSEAEITAALERGVAECDAVVTSGGVSMGAFDYIKVVLDRMSAGPDGAPGMSWMQIAIKPAKPFSFGVVGGKPVFGLPGNPVSSLVSFELLARPALRRMVMDPAPDRPRILAVADDHLRRRADGKVHFQRVHGAFGPDGRLHVRSTGPQGSHQLAATAVANGLAVLPDGDGVAPGGEVEVLLLG